MSARSTAFLGEMGVGPQWTLRNPPPAALFQDGLPEDGQPEIEAVPPAVAAPAVAAGAAPAAAAFAAAPAPVVAPAAPAAVVPPAAPAQAVPAAIVPAARPQPAPEDAFDASLPDDTAWFDDAPTPARAAPVSEAAIAAMDWPALKDAISSCTRCGLCATRRNAVHGRGAAPAEWMAIAAAPNRLDEKDATAVAGEAGQLLDNMLKAIGLGTATNAYVTQLVKCRPQTEDGADRSPTFDEVAACRPFLERELALTGAQMLLTFGQIAAKGLLGAASRGKVHRYGELPVVATYHPDDLLRKPEDKAKAWADLCLARSARD
jgi:DNA polymerase